MSRARFTHARVGRTQSALLVLLLLVTLVITGVLTREGSAAAKAHREAVMRLLDEHAAFAAERYSGMVSYSIASVFHSFYAKHGRDPERIDITQFRGLADLDAKLKLQCSCDPLAHVRYQFAFDYRTGKVNTSASVSAAERAEIVRVLRSHDTEQLREGWRMMVAADQPLPSGLMLGASVRVDTAGSPTYAIGFAADETFQWLPRVSVESFNQRLPRSDTTKKPHLFAISVFANGKPFYSGGTPSAYSASAQVPAAFGGMIVSASIHEASVPAIAGGQVPDRALPKFIGLMVLASLLILVVLILTKRESELSKVRADFVSGVSHELRTPLAQIRMFTETLLLGRVRNDAERKRSLEIIDQEAKRLTALVDNVLHLSRAERGAVRLTPAATPLAPAVREVIETFAQLPRSRGAEFRGELEERLIASVDPNALRQILLNLLDNAVKYGPARQRVHIGLAMFEEHARLWVDDEGPGIPLRERERVFEPFYRATTHLDSKVVGTGIGLAVVRELAGLLGGKVWAEDAPGGGARIVVEFPEAYLRAAEATGDWAVA